MKEIFELDDLVREFKLEFSSFKEKGNKSAGTRARKKLSELAKYCATVRKAIQEEKNNHTYCMISIFHGILSQYWFICIVEGERV